MQERRLEQFNDTAPTLISQGVTISRLH